MTRTELVERVADTLGMSEASVERVALALFELITDAIVSGEPVLIRAFGTIKTQTRAPRTGYDMYHKKLVPIPEQERVIFITSTTLRKKLAAKKRAR